jgi:predicted DNA binding CopG/RHH family protein
MFTLRADATLIRVISARDMHCKERARMNRKLKPRPAFENEADERAFWETHDSTDHVDWAAAERTRFPNLKPSTRAISLQLPVSPLERIKVAANKRDAFYQSLVKV